MYRPYFRGKQFELITIRESAKLLAENGFVPIIEPVQSKLDGLEKALRAVYDAHGTAIVIANPKCGFHGANGAPIFERVRDKLSDCNGIYAGILLTSEMSCDDAILLRDTYNDYRPTFVHAGFTKPKALIERLGKENLPGSEQVFVENHAELLYRGHFKGSTRFLIRDGFKRKKNASYLPVEEFSDLHVTFSERGMDGFGDFLIVGDDYSESGGPAYAVAIHLTFIDPDNDNVMYIHHFISDTNDTPTDPAGKFAQALKKLITKLNSGESKLYETESIKEFRELHTKGHFPGLGYVKKLSMKHHIETLAQYLSTHDHAE